jgi:hypothetical protein
MLARQANFASGKSVPFRAIQPPEFGIPLPTGCLILNSERFSEGLIGRPVILWIRDAL